MSVGYNPAEPSLGSHMGTCAPADPDSVRLERADEPTSRKLPGDADNTSPQVTLGVVGPEGVVLDEGGKRELETGSFMKVAAIRVVFCWIKERI